MSNLQTLFSRLIGIGPGVLVAYFNRMESKTEAWTESSNTIEDGDKLAPESEENDCHEAAAPDKASGKIKTTLLIAVFACLVGIMIIWWVAVGLRPR